MDTKGLQEKVKNFIDERDWRKLQTTKDQAISASVEANELLELFQWETGKNLDDKILNGKDPLLFKKIKNETADVFFSCLAIADQAGFDMEEAFLSKLEELEKRYDKHKVKGDHSKIPSGE